MDNQNDNLPFEFRDKEVSSERKSANWKGIEAVIGREQVGVGRRRLVLGGIVTACLLVIGALWFLKKQDVQQLTMVTTGYGEMKTIVLPDSSVVTLNANSTLRTPEKWSTTEVREVWLEGEAYFEVDKKPATKQKFVVHAKDVDVEVLGTRFNINTRRMHSVVSLEEGKIQLVYKGTENKKARQSSVLEKIELKPGDIAIIDTSIDKPVVLKEKAVEHRSGWVRSEFHFDNTPLSEVAQQIKEVYGYEVKVTDAELLQRSISGDLRVTSIKEFIKVLELALKVRIEVQDKTLIISN